MATMGRRKVNPGKEPVGLSKQIGTVMANLVVSPIQTTPVATTGFGTASPLGAPIMREGFVTDTGFLIRSSQD